MYSSQIWYGYSIFQYKTRLKNSNTSRFHSFILYHAHRHSFSGYSLRNRFYQRNFIIRWKPNTFGEHYYRLIARVYRYSWQYIYYKLIEWYIYSFLSIGQSATLMLNQLLHRLLKSSLYLQFRQLSWLIPL
jgi:hypothetical protein